MSTIRAALDQAVLQLADSETAQRDAELLLAQLLGKDRAYLYAWDDKKLGSQQHTAFSRLVEKRQKGWPLAYILGEQEFWSLPFSLTSDTLIPRPDTERLVEVALEIIHTYAIQSVVELGTGSGAIACALAHSAPALQVLATDISAKALAVATANGTRLALSNIQFVQADWFVQIEGAFGLIVSNPPYIAEGDPHLAALQHEPTQALVAGKDGLDAIRKIVAEAPRYLTEQGWLALEHGFEQAEKVRGLLQAHGFKAVKTVRDLAGNERVTFGQLL